MAETTPRQDSVMAAHGYDGRHTQQVVSLRIRWGARRLPGNPPGRESVRPTGRPVGPQR